MHIPPGSRIIRVTAFPSAKEDAIERDGEDRFRVYTRAAPKGGMATAAVIATVAKAFKVPQERLRIISGHQSRKKVLMLLP